MPAVDADDEEDQGGRDAKDSENEKFGHRRALLQWARPVVTEMEREFLAPLDADETAVLIRLLLRLMA